MTEEKKFDINKNRGVIIERPEDTDFIIGSALDTPYEVVNPTGEWPYPIREKQKFNRFDSYGCVSFSGNTSPEAQLIYLMTLPNFPRFIKLWLESNGYLVDGQPNFSDRYLVKLSGTKRGVGNSIKKVWDAMRHYGCVPEKDWPSWDDMSEDEYFAEVLQSVINKGMEFLKYFDISYTWMYGTGTPVSANSLPFKMHLKQAPIQTIVATCPPWDGSIIPACSAQPTHATLVCKNPTAQYQPLLDSYVPYDKKLSNSYQIWQAMKGVIKVKTQEITTEMVRWAYCFYPDIKKAFPAENKFYSPEDSNYSIFNWAFDWGIWDGHKEAFILPLDWSKISGELKAEAELLPEKPASVLKKTLFNKIIEFIKNLLTF